MTLWSKFEVCRSSSYNSFIIRRRKWAIENVCMYVLVFVCGLPNMLVFTRVDVSTKNVYELASATWYNYGFMAAARLEILCWKLDFWYNFITFSKNYRVGGRVPPSSYGCYHTGFTFALFQSLLGNSFFLFLILYSSETCDYFIL